MHAETPDCVDLGHPGNVGTAKPANKNTICQPAANPTCYFFSSFFDPKEICQGLLSDKNKPLIYRVWGKAGILMSQLLSMYKLLGSQWRALRIQASWANKHPKELKSLHTLPPCGGQHPQSLQQFGPRKCVYIIKAVTFPHLDFHSLPHQIVKQNWTKIWKAWVLATGDWLSISFPLSWCWLLHK